MIDLRNLNRRSFGKLMSLAAAAGAVAVSKKPAARGDGGRLERLGH